MLPVRASAAMGKTVPCPSRRAPPAASDGLQAPLTPPALDSAVPFLPSTSTSATMTEGADACAPGRVPSGGGRPEQDSRPSPEDVAPLPALLLFPLLSPSGPAAFGREGKAGGEDSRSHLSPKNHMTFALALGGAEPCETPSAPVARGGRPPARVRPHQHIKVLGDKGYHGGSYCGRRGASREALSDHLADFSSTSRTDGGAGGAPGVARDALRAVRDVGGRAGVRDPSESKGLLASSGNSWTRSIARCRTTPSGHAAGMGMGMSSIGSVVSVSDSAPSPTTLAVRTFFASPVTPEGSAAGKAPAAPALTSGRRSHGGTWLVVLLLLLASLHARVGVRASEFPDRECCDSAPPPPPHYHTTTSTTPVPRHRPTTTTTTTPAPPSFFPTSSVPPTGDGALGVRNCLLARQQCADDPSCRSVLEIIPRVCGPENVACSTVTVNKCLAALRTIQGFPYFQPTCLCREPHLDRECNVFREFLFDHPCMFVENKGLIGEDWTVDDMVKTGVLKADESPYTVHALPLCEYALNACELLPGCIMLYDQFLEDCRVKDGQCRMKNANKCLNSWTKLKASPMFGCICPTDHQKRKCQQIYRIVHDNPCVDTFPVSSAHPSPGQGGAGLWGIVLPPPPTPRPHYPYPPHKRPRLPPHTRPRPRPHIPWPPTPLPPHVTFITAEPLPAYSAQTQNVLTVDRHTTRTPGNSHGSFAVSAIPRDNSSLDAMDTQIQTPLVEGAEGGHHRQNETRVDGLLGSERPRYPDHPDANSVTMEEIGIVGNTYASPGPLPVLHSTCQTALTDCLADLSCRRLLDPVLARCDNDECNRETCMSELQTFYRNVQTRWGHEVAFCLCKKSSTTADECLKAQEKLHPVCARRPAGQVLMLCNRLAATCKEDDSCRHRLEFYEQACAVDSDTRRCAGPTAECRRAVLGILGTQLRNLCTCAATGPRETYTCIDWQRILWFNPCVVEAQTDYHRDMLSTLDPHEELTTSASIAYTSIVTTGVISEPVQSNGDPSGTRPVVIYPPQGPTSTMPTRAPRTTTTSTTTTTTTTVPPKYCVKTHDNSDKVDYIMEGGGRRYYKSEEECSELCICHADEKLACSVLDCVEAKPCETDFAVYAHAAPAYQAQRGECFCYSGSFICVRPEQKEYEMDYGVYLFLGYSKEEEKLLKPYTKTSSLVDAALVKLGKLVRDTAETMNGTACKLDLIEHIGENIILQATLEEFDYTRDNMSAIMLHKEKEECEESVTEVKDMINQHDSEIRADMALSLLMLAEVRVHVPPLPAAAALAHCPPLVLLTTLVLAALAASEHVLLAS
ncbi:uncharacterized protein LOC122243055 isoform X3 [Penaeus japonicus]|uniref:uncharacterized protein LOC122243055 isoform X3 n=1 Tax=Penaeus japonicus TaxID=27405 RepID=UPI001C713D57|nr:uncharacterized protein LOC122243055 isoform X3 [Penaeus japonicus]